MIDTCEIRTSLPYRPLLSLGRSNKCVIQSHVVKMMHDSEDSANDEGSYHQNWTRPFRVILSLVKSPIYSQASVSANNEPFCPITYAPSITSTLEFSLNVPSCE